MRDLEGEAFVFEFVNFDEMVAADPSASGILDILAREAWWHAIEGRPLVTLVHTQMRGRVVGGLIAGHLRWRGLFTTEGEAS